MNSASGCFDERRIFRGSNFLERYFLLRSWYNIFDGAQQYQVVQTAGVYTKSPVVRIQAFLSGECVWPVSYEAILVR